MDGPNWDCVPQHLTPPKGTYISNNAYDLNANTTIDGATILTDVDNTLVGLGLLVKTMTSPIRRHVGRMVL